MSQARISRISQLIAKDKVLSIPAWSAIKHTVKEWDFDVKLGDGAIITDARIEVIASQDVTSGASLEVDVNNKVLSLTEWHAFETGSKRIAKQVCPDCISGIGHGKNTIVLDYTITPNHFLTPASCKVHRITLVLTIKHPTSNPAVTSPTKVKERGRVMSWLNSQGKTTKQIFAICAVVGIATFAYGLSKRS